MSDFKKTELNLKNEAPVEVRVMKLDQSEKPVIKSFEFSRIQEAGDGEYQNTKSKYGPLASTDMDRPARPRKDSRFAINPLMRDPLAIEQEERRVIEEKVQAEISRLSEAARAKAAEEGFKEGQKQGHDEAYRTVLEQANEQMKSFETLIATFESAKLEVLRANERFLIEMVFRIGRTILLRELKTDREYVKRLAYALLDRMNVRENIRLKIHPDDFAGMDHLKEGLGQMLGSLKNLSVEPSSLVDLGGCMVETEWMAVDASIQTQLSLLHEELAVEPPRGEAESGGATP